MSTKSLDNLDEIREKFNNLLVAKDEEGEIEHDAFMLMASYLSEIEKFQDSNNITRKKLAELISTSGSYLTQVFRGDKPLNFYTLAKIQRALNVKFNVTLSSKGSVIYSYEAVVKNPAPQQPTNFRITQEIIDERKVGMVRTLKVA